MSKKNLTPRQKEVVTKIKELMLLRGKYPTLEELRRELGYKSTNSISQFLDVLEKKGLLRRIAQKERNIILREKKEISQIPIVGSVTCGLPILARQNIEGYLPISNEILGGDKKDFFVLKAMGKSLDKAGINDGDYVLVKSQNTANIGDKVVALIDDEATIKIYKPSRDFILLLPKSNDPCYKPIILNKDFLIQGVVRHVFKKEFFEN